MGAWIETVGSGASATASEVAPYMGAWIETSLKISALRNAMSHPTWVRGLKLFDLCRLLASQWSHPTWVRGLKPYL